MVHVQRFYSAYYIALRSGGINTEDNRRSLDACDLQELSRLALSQRVQRPSAAAIGKQHQETTRNR